jgi:3',5'-cyclic AMP phosphodiesterase CpdA
MKKLTLLLLLLLFLLVGCGTGAETVKEPAVPDTAPVTGTTEPAAPLIAQKLAFLFFGDTQPDPEEDCFDNVGKLLEQAVNHEEAPELVIFGGDTVNTGGDEAEWQAFWQAAGASLDGLTTAAVAGNHDSHALLAEQFDLPAEAPLNPGEGWFYSFRLGPVFFLMLDSNIMGAANHADIEWLQIELQSEAAQDANWRVAVMHHPMWPVSDIPRDIQRAETMREYFLPVLEQYGVDIILCGHQHVYSRTLPMRGDSVSADGRGIVQIMAASGDKASYAVGERDFLAAGAAAPNYALLIADESSLRITAYDGENRVIDWLMIND